MQRRTLLTAAIVTAVSAALPKLANAATSSTQEGLAMTNPANRPASGYAPVNGIELYYEIFGSGKPLVLLHGGLGAIEMFGPVLTALAEGRQVIGVDLQGHGRTLPFARPMTFASMANDVAELIRWLGYDKADVMGYSMGGMTALRVGLDHPEVVDRLILVSTVYAFAGWHDYNQQGMKSIGLDPAAAAEGMKQTPMYAQYVQLMPDPETNWIKTITQTGQLTGTEYDWSSELPGLKPPTLVIVGDWDSIRTSHVASMFELLGGGKQDANWDGSGMNANRLAVIPGATHYTIFMDPRLASIAAGFLDA